MVPAGGPTAAPSPPCIYSRRGRGRCYITERGLPFPGCQCRGILTNVVADAVEGGGVGGDWVIKNSDPKGPHTMGANCISGTGPRHKRPGFVSTHKPPQRAPDLAPPPAPT